MARTRMGWDGWAIMIAAVLLLGSLMVAFGLVGSLVIADEIGWRQALGMTFTLLLVVVVAEVWRGRRR